MFDVSRRHMVMSVPDKLWLVIRKHRVLLKVLMDAAIQAVNDTLSYCLRKNVMVGVIVVLHPFSRDISFKSHIHVLVTEGGFDNQGRFIAKRYIPARAMRLTWQYQVFTRFKQVLPHTPRGMLCSLTGCSRNTLKDSMCICLNKVGLLQK
jgi:hypothetical protein